MLRRLLERLFNKKKVVQDPHYVDPAIIITPEEAKEIIKEYKEEIKLEEPKKVKKPRKPRAKKAKKDTSL